LMIIWVEFSSIISGPFSPLLYIPFYNTEFRSQVLVVISFCMFNHQRLKITVVTATVWLWFDTITHLFIEYKNICSSLGIYLILCATVRWPLPLPFLKWCLWKNYLLILLEIHHKCHRPLGICT
jgi:hypothetical protein